VREPEVILRREGAVARIILNRPSARNALSVALCRDIIESLDRVSSMAERGEVRVATLGAAGPAFCAGADLKERAAMAPAAMSAHSQLIAECADRIEGLSCPVVACVRGVALGGGFELALACDLRVVAGDAALGFPEIGFGFFPGAGGPVRLVRLVGASTATYLLMSTRRITGESAMHLQIAHEAVHADSVDEAGFALALRIASHPPAGVRALRQLLRSLDEDRVREGMARARAMRDQLNTNPDVREALRSFARPT
jgi:enoyl-CoA hydratase/carnithine racemase